MRETQKKRIPTAPFIKRMPSIQEDRPIRSKNLAEIKTRRAGGQETVLFYDTLPKAPESIILFRQMDLHFQKARRYFAYSPYIIKQCSHPSEPLCDSRTAIREKFRLLPNGDHLCTRMGLSYSQETSQTALLRQASLPIPFWLMLVSADLSAISSLRA